MFLTLLLLLSLVWTPLLFTFSFCALWASRLCHRHWIRVRLGWWALRPPVTCLLLVFPTFPLFPFQLLALPCIVSLHGGFRDMRRAVPVPWLLPHSTLSTSSGPGSGVWCISVSGVSLLHFIACMVSFISPWSSCVTTFPSSRVVSSRSPHLPSAGPACPHCRALLSVSSFSILVFRVPPAAMSAHDAAAAVGTVSLTRRRIGHTLYRWPVSLHP
jgi:hypothetical protein